MTKLNQRVLKNAVIVPPQTIANGGGIWFNGHYLQESILHTGWYSERSLREPECFDVSDERVLYLGMFYGCWGHCITDGLKHLWPFLASEIAKCRDAGFKFVYVTTGIDEDLPKGFKDCLKLLGVDLDEAIHLKKPTRFREAVLPEPSFVLISGKGRIAFPEYEKTVDALIRACGADAIEPTRKIYLTRAAWKTVKADRGERTVANAFEKAGYEIVSPELLTFEEQVRLMRSCAELATTEGSCAHNAVFMHEGAKLTIIKKAEYHNGYQEPINEMRRLQVKIIRANWSKLLGRPKAPWRGPFYLYVSRELSDYLGVRPCFSMWEFVKYVGDYLRVRPRVIASHIKHDILGL